MFVSNRAPKNWFQFCFVSIYKKADQANVSIYIAECKGVPSTHKTGTVTVVNLKRERGKPTDIKKDGSVRITYLNTPN